MLRRRDGPYAWEEAAYLDPDPYGYWVEVSGPPLYDAPYVITVYREEEERVESEESPLYAGAEAAAEAYCRKYNLDPRSIVYNIN